MKKNFIISVLMIFLLFFTLNAVYAQRGNAQSETINIRIASSLPRGSEWGRALDRLAADWQKITSNQVRAIVIHDALEGTEAAMLRKLRSNQIQVAIFTSAGLTDICPAVMSLSVPFMIRDNKELDVVLKSVTPMLEKRVDNDFVILTWSKGGWVYIFSKEKVVTPSDLRRQKLGTSPELKDMNTAFRTMGFNLVEADFVNIGIRLANNTIDTVYWIPAFLVPMQIHRNLNHMLELPIAPVMGALVMNRVTWNKLSPAHQQNILDATHKMGLGFDASMAKTESDALSTMGKDGLNVNKITEADRAVWQTEIQRAIPSLVGTIFDREIYNHINDLLERTRSGR